MRRTKEDADKTRQILLDAALTAFSRKGYAAARLEDIAEAAEVTRGAIYHHFQSKAGLYLALFDEASRQGNEAIAQAISEGGTFTQICARVLTYALSLLERDRRFREVMALSLYRPESAPELAALDRLREEQAVALVESVAGFMRQGIAQGALRSDLDPSTMARAFIAYQNGIIALWLANRNAFSIAQCAPAFASILMEGMAAR